VQLTPEQYEKENITTTHFQLTVSPSTGGISSLVQRVARAAAPAGHSATTAAAGAMASAAAAGTSSGGGDGYNVAGSSTATIIANDDDEHYHHYEYVEALDHGYDLFQFVYRTANQSHDFTPFRDNFTGT
jgi:hypothetical protein